MKYSYHWLKELTKTKKNPAQLANLVMLKGFELEEIIDLSQGFDNFVVGEILELQKHPKADKLQLVKVDVGAGQPLEIVCGAWNMAVGDKVPVALVGAIVPQNKMKVEKREVRGVVSNGMLCAEDEVGLGKDHAGIIILDKSAKIGEPLVNALKLKEIVIDLSILPNRAHDCLCHVGMAREICAMEGNRFIEKRSQLETSHKGKMLSIKIEDKKLCPRYIGAVLSQVKIAPSPQWMQARLVAAGMEPINNVVDITNYVMLELGNPLHAFDLEKIKSKDSQVEIVVRKAHAKEQLELLDNKKLDLDENDLLITNGQTALALAGIKGGKNSGITSETKTIVLEAANFNAFSIRKTRQRHALNTESQARFEKSISPVLAEEATARAIELLQEHAGAKFEEIVDAGEFEYEPQFVELTIETVHQLLGHTVETSQIIEILENLGFELKSKNKTSLKWGVPYWRLDIEGPEDLIEEVGRLMGYEKIEDRPLVKAVTLPARNKQRELEWKMKDRLTALGFDEVINYSFYGTKDAQLLSANQKHWELANSLTVNQDLMRQTLLAGILQNVSLNQKYFDNFDIFEIGRVYVSEKGLPKEFLKISGASFIHQQKPEELFYHLKGKLEAFLNSLIKDGIIEFRSHEQSINQAFKPVRSADIYVNQKLIGTLGEISQIVQKHYDLNQPICVFELDFESLSQLAGKIHFYQPLRKYPEVKRDISLFVPFKTETAQVLKVIQETAQDLLLSVDLFDVYLDPKNNRKSLAFHLAFGADDRTLESFLVDEVVQKIMQQLETKLKAQIRK